MPPAINQASQANTPAIVTSAGIALAANDNRRYWSIQNVGQNPIFINLGGTASSTVFHYVLKGGTADSDGLGAFISSDAVCFTGAITVAGTTPKFVVTEM
jgi:hypothetical protein